MLLENITSREQLMFSTGELKFFRRLTRTSHELRTREPRAHFARIPRTPRTRAQCGCSPLTLWIWRTLELDDI